MFVSKIYNSYVHMNSGADILEVKYPRYTTTHIISLLLVTNCGAVQNYSSDFP